MSFIVAVRKNFALACFHENEFGDIDFYLPVVGEIVIDQQRSKDNSFQEYKHSHACVNAQ